MCRRVEAAHVCGLNTLQSEMFQVGLLKCKGGCFCAKIMQDIEGPSES